MGALHLNPAVGLYAGGSSAPLHSVPPGGSRFDGWIRRHRIDKAHAAMCFIGGHPRRRVMAAGCGARGREDECNVTQGWVSGRAVTSPTADRSEE